MTSEASNNGNHIVNESAALQGTESVAGYTPSGVAADTASNSAPSIDTSLPYTSSSTGNASATYGVSSRLFRLANPPIAAVASPYPRLGQHENRRRELSPEPAIPDPKVLADTHADTFRLIARFRPLRANLLRDLMQRIESSIKRFNMVVEEEEQSLRNYNDDAATAQRDVQGQIEKLYDERERIKKGYDDECGKRRVALAVARLEYAAERARTDRPLPLLSWTKQNDDEELAASRQGTVLIPPSSPESSSLEEGDTPTEEEIAPTAAGPSSLQQTAKPSIGLFASLFRRSQAEPRGEAPAPQAIPAQVTVRFPVEQGREQARPAEVHAYENGYSSGSPASDLARGNRLMNALSLVTCGAIFGSSVGLLLGFIDPDAMSVAAFDQIKVWSTCVLFGIALFYIIGQTAEILAALVSEQYHAALLASHRDDRVNVGRWLFRAAKWTTGIGLLILVLLAVIEAVIERYGLVQLAMLRMADAVLLNHHLATRDGINHQAADILALIASVPFLLYHAARGWAKTRAVMFTQAMTASHIREAWSIATRLYAEQVARVQAAEAERASASSDGSAVDAPTAPQIEKAKSPAEDEEPQSALQAVQEKAASIEGEAKLKAVSEAEAIDQRVALARANENLRTAWIGLREAYAARREALRPFDERIRLLDSMIKTENLEWPTDAKRRREDAYCDVQEAIKQFDVTLRDEMQIYERLAKGGIWARFKNWLLRPALDHS